MSDFAAVVGGSLVACVSGFTAQEQDDILNSVAYSELKANETQNRLHDPVEWFTEFTYELSMLGWEEDEDILYGYIPELRYTYSLEEAALSNLQDFKFAALASILKRSIKAMKLDDYAQGIFEGYSSSGTLNYAQFLPCERQDEKGSFMYVSSMHITTISSMKGFIFKRLSADAINLKHMYTGFHLRHEDYAKHRETVVKTLNATRYKYIQELKIS